MSRLPAVYYDTSATSTRIVRDWRRDAACLRVNPEMFFASHRDRPTTEAAIQVCQRCPVMRQCGDWAISQDEQGVWGGMDDAQRKAERKRRGASPVAPYEPCGTEAARKRHERAGERCETCRRGANVRKADRAEQRASA